MFERLLHYFFHRPRPDNAKKRPALPEIRFKVAVAEFYDRGSSSKGQKLADLLSACEGFDVCKLTPDFDLSFLKLESRNFFDLTDHGQNLLDKTGADVLVWGCCDEGRLRLNLQTPTQNKDDEKSFVSLLDNIYMAENTLDDDRPFPELLLNLLAGSIVCAVSGKQKEEQIYKTYLLKKIINRISEADSAKTVDLSYMPYILNQVGLIYMTAAVDKFGENDYKTIRSLFDTALKYRQQILETTQLGCLYMHLGQLNDLASVCLSRRQNGYFRDAIRNYRQAQKLFGKYTYPYEHGHICYKLSGLYYNYWKRTEDTQALRDSVAQLRECERIFTEAQFPQFWSHIEGNLGYLLHNLANLTRSTEICRLAVAAFRNQQKIISENRQPYQWAQLQEKIAEIYYLEGKISANPEALEEALACYHDALYLFETGKHETSAGKTRIGIAKTRELLNDLAAADEKT